MYKCFRGPSTGKLLWKLRKVASAREFARTVCKQKRACQQPPNRNQVTMCKTTSSLPRASAGKTKKTTTLQCGATLVVDMPTSIHACLSGNKNRHSNGHWCRGGGNRCISARGDIWMRRFPPTPWAPPPSGYRCFGGGLSPACQRLGAGRVAQLQHLGPKRLTQSTWWPLRCSTLNLGSVSFPLSDKSRARIDGEAWCQSGVWEKVLQAPTYWNKYCIADFSPLSCPN